METTIKEFKGTNSDWNYKQPTQKFDACTIAENGKIIGYSASGGVEDIYNEKLRAAAPKLLDALQEITNNIDNWLETGEAASPEESERLHEKAKSAISSALEE